MTEYISAQTTSLTMRFLTSSAKRLINSFWELDESILLHKVSCYRQIAMTEVDYYVLQQDLLSAQSFHRAFHRVLWQLAAVLLMF